MKISYCKKQARAIVFVILIPAWTGCIPATFQPGSGVDITYARIYGCDYEKVMADVAHLKTGLVKGTHYIPRVGWTVCELLAHIGTPNKIELQESQYSKSQSWWYKEPGQFADLHLVNLEWSDARGTWIVDYVGW